MYWYKPKYNIIFFSAALIVLWTGCKPGLSKNGAAEKYFDINGYFRADSARLAKQNPEIIKTVTHDGVTQTQTVHIADWGAELAPFRESDINRPAWRDSYNIATTGDGLGYRALDSTLKMRDMVIRIEKGKVKWMVIYNKAKNFLYKSTEKLSYFPDSLYIIERVQHVKLMGTNSYMIRGVIKH